MPTYFQRPENALKRAKEFIDVGKKNRALDALYDLIKSRKHRTWQKVHEPVMQLYLELCVDLKKSHVAKEGLFQYRNICQQVNIKSLEDVVRGYLDLAEEKTESARAQSQQQAVLDVDDLDQVQTPESLLLSAVSNEGAQDRSDRVMLIPWVKFLWESYRQCLELLRNNMRVERLYHDIAQQAFRFCLKYNRKTEFRKLCESLRMHLSHIHRYQGQQTTVNLNNPESQAMHLETRLVQLDSAIQMELWQEAYRATEDIHSLMLLSKKQPKPGLMANYYQKLALVFFKAGNGLFHSSALFRYFHISKELKKSITPEEIRRLAARVVVATLAIPMPPNRPEIDRMVETDEGVIDKNQRLLANLLGLPNPPTRASLIKDLVRLGVVNLAPQPIQELYRWLEIEFQPLHLWSHVEKSLDFVANWNESSELKAYLPALNDITMVRLLKEVSQVYQSIEIDRLLELAPFATPFSVEQAVVDAARRNDLQVRIDHKRKCLHFGTEVGVSQREEPIEGPHLQGMPSERIRHQLMKLYSVLHQSVEVIRPDEERAERDKIRAMILRSYRNVYRSEHKKILERQVIIEHRKEMLESLNQKREKEERKQHEEAQMRLRELEEERLAREAEERARARLKREEDERKRKVTLEKIEQLKKTELGARIFEGLEEEELEKLNPEEIYDRQCQQLVKEQKELQMRLKKQERQMDYTERAKRLIEIPLLQAAYEKSKVADEKFWNEMEAERIKQLIAEREAAMEQKTRLAHMHDDKEMFLRKLQGDRHTVYLEKKKEFEEYLAEVRMERLQERKEQRKRERREEYLRKKEEAELRAAEEERRRKEEERRRILDEAAEKQRQRELEVEEKLQREREEERKKEEELRMKERDDRRPVEQSSWRKEAPPAAARDGDDRRNANAGPTNWRDREAAPRSVPDRRTGGDNKEFNRGGGRNDRGGGGFSRGGGRDSNFNRRGPDEGMNWRSGGGGGAAPDGNDNRPPPRAQKPPMRRNDEPRDTNSSWRR